MSRFTTLLLCSLLALVAGCNSVDSRIRKNEATFRALDPETQDKLRAGKVEVGYTPDMVFIALGKPTTKTERSTKDGQTMVWTYTSTSTEYAGKALTHTRRVVVVDPRTGRRAILIQPVYSDVYRETEDEDVRVEFKDGKVTSIESTE
jgi:hypothetical protein